MDDDDEVPQCSVCFTHFSNMETLRKHMAAIHKKEAPAPAPAPAPEGSSSSKRPREEEEEEAEAGAEDAEEEDGDDGETAWRRGAATPRASAAG